VTIAKSRGESSGKPRISTEPLYLLLREGRVEDFNRRRAAGESVDLTGCNLRGLDLKELDATELDLSNCYLRQADLRGLDLRTCRLEGASLHAAHVSGVYFPASFAPAEIELSVRLGTRLRPTPDTGR
jgi:uncharacterized protein YjbI with pentapeptide repeats